jgi:hypothetical protein
MATNGFCGQNIVKIQNLGKKSAASNETKVEVFFD